MYLADRACSKNVFTQIYMWRELNISANLLLLIHLMVFTLNYNYAWLASWMVSIQPTGLLDGSHSIALKPAMLKGGILTPRI